MAKRYPKSRWLILRKTYDTLQKTTLITFSKLLTEGLQNDIDKWDQGNLMATLYNGSQVFFMSESYENDKELNRFRGLEINGVGVDEMNEIQEVTFNKLIERAGSWQHSPGCPIKIIGTCNPSNNWVKKSFYDRWVKNELPNGWAYVPAKIFDNPHIDKAYIESLKLMPTLEYQKFVDGDWNVVYEGQLFSPSELAYYRPEKIEGYDTPMYKVLTVDPADRGGDNLAAPSCRLVGNRIYVDKVTYNKKGTDATIPHLVEWICQHQFHTVQIEGNSAWILFAKAVRDKVWEKPRGENIDFGITKAVSNKATRIYAQSAFIKWHFSFLEKDLWDDEYTAFMTDLSNYMLDGGSDQKDDAPDSLVMAAEFFGKNFSELW